MSTGGVTYCSGLRVSSLLGVIDCCERVATVFSAMGHVLLCADYFSYAIFTLICFGLAFSAFGIVTTNRPFLYSACTPASSTSTGRSKVLTNFPMALSLL